MPRAGRRTNAGCWRRACRSGHGSGVEFTEHAGFDAGLRIVAGRNVVDATLAGLLADREAIGARLLGELGVAS